MVTADAFDAIVARLRAAGCVYAQDEARLLAETATSPEELARLVGQRETGVPVEYLVGWARFCGLQVVVRPGVFVPRPRSESLVRSAVGWLADHRPVPPMTVLDLCCGSAAVGLAVVASMPATLRSELHAVDVDPVAVACARENVATVAGTVYHGDLYEPLPDTLQGRVDLLLANPPYVPTAEVPLLPREAREFEPHRALDGGRDGLEILRRIAAEAPRWLAPHGRLYAEVSAAQVPAAQQVMLDAGLVAMSVRAADHTTVVSAQLTPGRRPSAQHRRGDPLIRDAESVDEQARVRP